MNFVDLLKMIVFFLNGKSAIEGIYKIYLYIYIFFWRGSLSKFKICSDVSFILWSARNCVEAYQARSLSPMVAWSIEQGGWTPIFREVPVFLQNIFHSFPVHRKIDPKHIISFPVEYCKMFSPSSHFHIHPLILIVLLILQGP